MNSRLRESAFLLSRPLRRCIILNNIFPSGLACLACPDSEGFLIRMRLAADESTRKWIVPDLRMSLGGRGTYAFCSRSVFALGILESNPPTFV
jgi:hypothetical protein